MATDDKPYSVEQRLNAALGMVSALSGGTQQNFTAERNFGRWLIPAGDPSYSGAAYRLTGWGSVSTTGTPNLTLRLRITDASGSQLLSTGVQACANNAAGLGFSVDCLLCFETSGGSGALSASGLFICNAFTGNPFSSVNRNNGIDTTSDMTIALTAQWSAASSSNVVTSSSGQVNRVRG